MEQDGEIVPWAGSRPRAKAGRFDQISIAFHWLTVLGVGAQFLTIWLLGQQQGGPVLMEVHRSVGVATWIVAAARFYWRHRYADLPPFPASMPKLQQRIATLNEYGLYGLLLVQPLTGLGDVLFRGHSVRLFAVHVPPLLPAEPAVFHLLHGVHEAGAAALAALVGLHAAAALLHGLVLRDGVLERMLPWTER